MYIHEGMPRIKVGQNKYVAIDEAIYNPEIKDILGVENVKFREMTKLNVQYREPYLVVGKAMNKFQLIDKDGKCLEYYTKKKTRKSPKKWKGKIITIAKDMEIATVYVNGITRDVHWDSDGGANLKPINLPERIIKFNNNEQLEQYYNLKDGYITINVVLQDSTYIYFMVEGRDDVHRIKKPKNK